MNPMTKGLLIGAGLVNIGCVLGALAGWYGLLFNLVVLVGVIIQRDQWEV